MGIFDWLKGKKSAGDPEQVFASAIEEYRERYRKSRDLVASVLRERDATRAAAEKKRAELEALQRQARQAVDNGDDALALTCLERAKGLEAQVEDLAGRLTALENDAARAREMLVKLDAEVERLEHDRGQAAYLAESAGAHQSLSGMLRDLGDPTASPSLDRARSSLEHASLTQRYAHELDEQDRLDAAGEESAAEKLRQLKQKMGR